MSDRPVRSLSDSSPPRSNPSPTEAAEGDPLLEQLLDANRREQSGDLTQARSLYEDLIEQDPDGFYGISARKALNHLGESNPAITAPATASSSGASGSGDGLSSLPQAAKDWLSRCWQDLSFTHKLTILLVSGSVIPVAITTLFLVARTQERVQEDFLAQLNSDVASWGTDYVMWTEDDSFTEAENLSQLVAVRDINLSNPQQIEQERRYLDALATEALAAGDRNRADTTKSFRILTDAQGNTVAQGIKIHTSALHESPYPPVPEPDREISAAEFQRIQTQPGIALGDLDIVRAALETGQPQRGIEILPSGIISRLGLEPQAKIPLRESLARITQPPPLPLSQRDFALDVDDFQAGLTTVVVFPVRLEGAIVGTTIVGVLHNRHHALLDEFQQLFGAEALSVYAQDWRVNTNIDAGDGTRAIGTLAPAPVVRQVLQAGQDNVSLVENIDGKNYLTVYRPLYDHTRRTNPEVAPIGMVSVARPQTELEQLVRAQQLLGLAVGGGAALIVSGIAIVVAKAFAKSLEDLAAFAQRVGRGERGVRVHSTERADEIGILSQELNQMAVSIEVNMASVEQQETLRRQEAEQQRREKERLQRGVMNLLLEIEGAQRGDLTVNAAVTDGAVGSIADAFNTTIIRLRELVSQVQSIANQVNDLASNNTPVMQQLSRDATVQAQEISRTLGTVAQIVESIRVVDQSAQQAAAIAQQGAKTARDGEEVMDLTVLSIKNISAAVAETASKVDRLTDSFKQILQILTIISGISERTNLLAYNASIEASRVPGEYGQGFRVVAEEVRRLAGRATEATRSIEQIVEIIQQDTVEVQQAMEVGKSEVAEGTERVAQTKQTLKGLADLSQTIDQYVQAISQNTTTQRSASKQVNQMVEQVSSMTENTSATAQTVTESLEELRQAAATLKDSVAQFRL
ncbi:methyl-accepting chemotaxis protein [Sodalinema gerasimenkoae]|uniref:methyl-accepting chemotaxis protein n=1 Tax=Sodalinema gerasimenkoae TaxID=2862348 RepID=UPI00135C8FD1|nr:methyl-accepting chemotaxis protein [Sodalinema gerasimenkoae]